MDLFLYNTLTKQKEKFTPQDPQRVGMYNCGPTVYAFVHIGNLRAYVFADILKRVLQWNDYTVKQVINITDVGQLTSDGDDGEDKMTKGLKREGLPITLEGMKNLADRYTEAFLKDIERLNISQPDVLPRASEHIKEQIGMIRHLEEKEAAYVTSDGVYFNTSAYPEYGKLGGLTPVEEMQARIEHAEKKHPHDFALWKFNEDLGWESPWGRGFPGWHIECSAMSMKYLGETFDIHTGGIDHIPVHHNNVIAQSEMATVKPFAHYWLHIAFITISGDKIAKSVGNTIYLYELEKHGISPLSYRYWLLTSHYRTQSNFTWEALLAAHTAYQKLCQKVSEVDEKENIKVEAHPVYIQRFTQYINDDLDTPGAIALLWELWKDTSLSQTQKRETTFVFDEILGLGFSDSTATQQIPEEVLQLMDERENARNQKDWDKADELREKMQILGFTVKDTEEGQKIYPHK